MVQKAYKGGVHGRIGTSEKGSRSGKSWETLF